MDRQLLVDLRPTAVDNDDSRIILERPLDRIDPIVIRRGSQGISTELDDDHVEYAEFSWTYIAERSFVHTVAS